MPFTFRDPSFNGPFISDITNVTASDDATKRLTLFTGQEWEYDDNHKSEQIQLVSTTSIAKSVLAFRLKGDFYSYFGITPSTAFNGDTVFGMVSHIELNPVVGTVRQYETLPGDWTTYNQRIVGGGGATTTRAANTVTIPGHGFSNGDRIWTRIKNDVSMNENIGGVPDGQNSNGYVQVIDANTIRIYDQFTAPSTFNGLWIISGDTTVFNSNYRMIVTNRWLHAHVSFESASPNGEVHTRMGFDVLKYACNVALTQSRFQLKGAGCDIQFLTSEAANQGLMWGDRQIAFTWGLRQDTNKNMRLTAFDANYVASATRFVFSRLTDQASLHTSTLVSGIQLHIPGTGAVSVPSGTTAQRPASLTIPWIRYNTDTSSYEVSDPATGTVKTLSWT